MKTHQDWPQGVDLGKYLNIGDIVDERMVEHFRNVMPAAVDKEDIVQMGEAAGFANGKNVFWTLARCEGDQWVYVGRCHLGTKGNGV